MSERRSDRWLSIALAVATHAAIVVALVWGYWHYRRPPPPQQQLAIEATVVDESRLPPGTLPGKAVQAERVAPPVPEPVAETPPEPAPTPEPVPKAEPPPKPKPEPRKSPPEQAAQKAAQRKAAEQQTRAEAQEKLKLAADKAVKEKADREKAEKERTEKEKADKARAAKEEADRRVREDAERKAKEEAERVAREKAAADKQKAQLETELRRSLAAEEHFAAARASGQLAQYQAQIRARIERAWIRPASARPGLSCEVRITQVQGGEVVGVQVGSCNGDDTVRQSIEAAAYRASPLPMPPDPALFDRNLVVTFKPQD